MAEEHLSTAFGAFGAADVLLRSCMEGFKFWKRINDSSESALQFLALLDFQRTKLAVWGDAWDVESNRHHKDRWFALCKPAVINHLELIHRILDDFGNLDTPALVLDQTRDLVSTGTLPHLNHLSTSSSPYRPAGSESAFTMRGIKWALQEKELNNGLALLTTLISDLCSILPPQRIDPAEVLILSESLTTQDPNELETISRVKNIDPFYATLAWMGSIACRPYGTRLELKQLSMKNLQPINRKEGDTKFMARYEGELVFVEEKQCTAPWSRLGHLSILRARLESIIVRLQNPDKPVELRTLPCRGAIYSSSSSKRTAQGTTWVYNVVYYADYPYVKSLQEVLNRKVETSTGSKPKSLEEMREARAQWPLGKRFVLARQIARAIMYLHLAKWLHKAVRSENVIFFVENESVRIDSPYLIGFEHSRLDVAGEQTENIDEKPDHKYYRHPKATAVPVADDKQPLGGPARYSKTYDIYSLGVVLLEIGLFAQAKHIVYKYDKTRDKTSEEILKVFIENAIPDLRYSMGNVYADAVLVCLDGSFDNIETKFLHQHFYRRVICKLDSCKA